MQAIATDVVCSMVCFLVIIEVRAKMVQLIEMPFWGQTRVGCSRNHVFDGVCVVVTWQIWLNDPCSTAVWSVTSITCSVLVLFGVLLSFCHGWPFQRLSSSCCNHCSCRHYQGCVIVSSYVQCLDTVDREIGNL